MEVHCFYGKESCSVALHKKALVYGVPNRWYIKYGTQSTSNYFYRSSLPSFENGDPIPYNFQAQMQDPLLPSFVGLILGHRRFVFDDLECRRVETPDEGDKITPQSVPVVENVLMESAGFEPEPISSDTKQTLDTPQTSTKTDTIIKSKFMVEAGKAASMVIYVTVFQALLNRVETLEMDLDKAIFQLGYPRIENLEMKSWN